MGQCQSNPPEPDENSFQTRHFWLGRRARCSIIQRMNHSAMNRRQALSAAGLLLTVGTTSQIAAATPDPFAPAASASGSSFRFSLNTATIRGQKLGLEKEVEIAASAGYEALEPWVESIEAFKKSGKSLSDLKKKIADLGLSVASAIAFPEWIVDDDAQRAQGLERAKREMDLVLQLGGKRIACPPSGAVNVPGLEPAKAAERYRALLEAGDAIGVLPQFELWGFSQCFHRLGDCVSVAMESGHPKACVLIDVFHLHKGGTNHHGLGLLAGNAVHVLHMNDYPAEPGRAQINDSYRIFPGDGVAPLVEILRYLRQMGGTKVLSLELFSLKFWGQDPMEVAKAGLAKMKATVELAMAK